MGTDSWLVFRWWGTLFLVGSVAFPLTKRLFAPPAGGWPDRGYLFSKAVGMAVVTYIVYVLASLHILPFTQGSIVLSLVVIFLLGLALQKGDKGDRGHKGYLQTGVIIFLEEAFFFAALLVWAWVKGHEPSIHGLEKFMDFGFTKSILNSSYFPAPDMWYAGYPINYYYFGHTVLAVLTKLSGIDLVYTFNLILATLFALTLTMSFSIGVQLLRIRGIRVIRAIGGGILTAFLVTLSGNMQTLYAFTQGYSGDAVKPFWELWWHFGEMRGIGEIWGKLGEGMSRYWYANATRFIPYTIHEFPSYSFVVSDIHGHVLSLPFVLLAIGLLIVMFSHSVYGKMQSSESRIQNWLVLGFYGFLVAVLLMTNALDGPIYFALLVAVLIIQSSKFRIQNWGWWKEKLQAILPVGVVAAVTAGPFLWHFKSFVNGIAVNCPLPFLANTKIGPLLLEGVEKCQHSPLWMMYLLWGFFWFCGAVLIARNAKWPMLHAKYTLTLLEKIKKLIASMPQQESLLVVFFVFSLGLIIFPEFFYFKDIYPAHFRSNTMFKLGYDAFILFSIVAGYTIVQIVFGTNQQDREEKIQNPNTKFQTKSKIQIPNSRLLWGIFIFLLLPQLFLVSIYPIFSVRSYFNSLRTYEGLDGLAWLQRQYPDDWAGIGWLNSQNAKCQMPNLPAQTGAKCEHGVIVEADGDSYTDYARISAFTGLPTIIGWPVHEWLWRGSYDVVAPRREEVRKIYESEDREETRTILSVYGVRYIILGQLEREKYKSLALEKLSQLGKVVFAHGQTVIYEVEE